MKNRSKKIKFAGYWTKERCLEEALKHKSRTEFSKNSKGAYGAAFKNGWLNECYAHMELIGNRFKRLIYAVIFQDNHIYVGLTYNTKIRFNFHLNNKKSSVCKHIIKTGLKPEFKKLTDFLDANIASVQEGIFEKQYIERGYVILNKVKTGALGGDVLKWTKNKCITEIKKYKSLSEFILNNDSAYRSVVRNGWIDILSQLDKNKPNGYWNIKKNCLHVALKCSSLSEFRKKYSTACKYSVKNGWFEEICIHIKRKIKPAGYWTKENCYIESKKYKTHSEFELKNPSTYYTIFKNGWSDILYHLKREKNEKGYWTLENCKIDALSCKSKTEWQKKSGAGYYSAHKHGWLNECCEHMKK